MMLEEVRKARGLSKRRLANMIGSCDVTIRKYETGERRPSLRTIRKLAVALGVNTNQLVASFYADVCDVEGQTGNG